MQLISLVSIPPTEGVTLLSHWSLKSQHYSLQARLPHVGVPFGALRKGGVRELGSYRLRCTEALLCAGRRDRGLSMERLWHQR